MEHTELPWHNPKYTRRDGNNACWIMDGGKRPKAICRCCEPNAEEHAAYIVRACKAFSAMEKALTITQKALVEHGNLDHIWTPSLIAIEAALAAGGE